jgi:hypothetical protein
MLSHCANSECARPFLRLRQGKLFLVEKECGVPSGESTPPCLPQKQPPRRVERYWLCDECAKVWTLVHDRHQGIVLVPLPPPPASARPAMGHVCRETA